MKVKRKTDRRRLIAQTSRNPESSTTKDSDSERIVHDEEADITVGETASTPAAFKKLVNRSDYKLTGILTANAFDSM